jgi:hypothetical protein
VGRAKGLRTLVLASRVVSQEEWTAWNGRYQSAAASLEGREAAIAEVAAQLEHDLDIVGVSAIEDKLQHGVPQAIKTLIAAGIKVRSLPIRVFAVPVLSFLVGEGGVWVTGRFSRSRPAFSCWSGKRWVKGRLSRPVISG